MLICAGGLLVIFIFVFLLYKSVIFQEGNPAFLVRGIMRLNFTKDKIVKLKISGDKYLTKSKDGQEILINKLKENNYRFIENLGSGYFFINDNLDILIITKKQYSRFYSIWNISEPRNIRESIEWTEYKNKAYGFIFNYPVVSVNNKWWGNLSEEKPLFNLLLPNQVLSKNNNFYLTQKYDVEVDKRNGELIKTENTFIPEYLENNHSYPLPWHIVILDIESEESLDSIIKQKLGLGCRYKTKLPTGFSDNYKIEIDGDGQDLGSTLCPVNYANYIIYSPSQKKIAFWSTGQECQIGLGFFYNNCFDEKISDSFHFIGGDGEEAAGKALFVVSGELACLPLLDGNKPHNDLCVLGIKSNDDYYRLQAPSDDKNNVVNKIKKGQKIEISGELVNEKDDTYKILGTIKVAGVKHLPTDEKDLESSLPEGLNI